MKGIVVEINKNEAIILADDGLFKKVKNQNYSVGQAIEIHQSRKTYSKLVAGAASMVAAFAVCTIGAYAWFTPTDYVSLDVNPSVEYSLNTFDRILKVQAVNDDGAEILDSLDLKNMKIEDALKETLNKLMADGYLANDPNGGVVITTSNDKMGDAEQLAEELEQDIQSYLDDQEGITAKVDAEAVAPDRVQEARELGVTPGKLNLVEKLQKSTTGAISVDEWLTKPVKEINKAIKDNKKAEKDGKEAIDRPEQDNAATKGGMSLEGKPKKPDKAIPAGKDRTEDRNKSTNGGVVWNDQSPAVDSSDNEKLDRSADPKNDKTNNDQLKDNEKKDDQKTNGAPSDSGKPPKDSGNKDKDSSGKDKDKDQNN